MQAVQPKSTLISQEQLATNDRQYMGEQQQQEEQEPSAVQSREFGQMLDMATGNIVRLLQAGNAKGNVPAYNRHEAAGRTGLVDPVSLGQGTILPIERRMEQNANFKAMMGALPPEVMQRNMMILNAIDKTPIQFQKQLKMQTSIYTPPSRGDFMTNRVNLALQSRRQNSIYAFI